MLVALVALARPLARLQADTFVFKADTFFRSRGSGPFVGHCQVGHCQVGHCQVAQPFVSDSAKPAHVKAPASSTDSSFESEVLRRLVQILICHLAMACARHARHRDHGTVRRRNPIWSLISSDPSPPVARARIAVMYRRQRNRSGASVNNQKRCSWERNLGPAEGHSASVSSGCSTVCIVGH